MAAGCMNIDAANYDPLATEPSGDCVFLVKYLGVCYAFQEVSPVTNKSYTLSYSFDGKDWVFFHDYIGDYYFHTKKDLYSVKNNKIYRHNTGLPGEYYTTGSPKSFFVDAVFRDDNEMILNSVQWMTEVLDNQKEIEFSTLTHLTIWNNQQCTGRIAIADIYAALEFKRFKNKSHWSFSDFRDLVKTEGAVFLKDLFSNFEVETTEINVNKPWYEQQLLQDNFFIVRFEFDNTSQKQLILHEVGVNISKSPR